MQEIDLIFQHYYRPLCLYATHYLHDIDEAEDVVQDCFVKLISRSIMPENIKAFFGSVSGGSNPPGTTDYEITLQVFADLEGYFVI